MEQSTSRPENLLRLQARVLEQIATDICLQTCLDLICKLVQGVVPGSICSVMLLDENREALYVKAAPNVPKELQALLDGLVPCRQAGSCGTAVFLDEPVYVTDTATDPRWPPLQDIATALGIRACWSIPVRSRSGEVYGSFAISHLECRTPDESHKQLLTTAAHLAGIALDRDRQIQELNAARVRAEEASRAKTDFVANMSHEIRTPLTAILGFAELLKDPELGSNSVGEFVRTIQRSAHYLMTILDDVLDSAKIESGRMSIEKVGVDPALLLEEITETIASSASDKGIELEIFFDTRVPKSIQSDPTRLRQILLNIVGNAVKFTERGSVHIRVECDPGNEVMKFHIIDTGIGMTEEQVQIVSLFDAFRQADTSTTRQYGGTGLGLRISNSLAQMLGGGLEIKSKVNVGSAFTVVIATGCLKHVNWRNPNEAKRVRRDGENRETCLATDGSKLPLKGFRVLVAEDGPDNQRLIKLLLEKAGACVTLCENGQIALDAMEMFPPETMPHLILMDMQMPEVDGYTATQTLRTRGLRLPIVAITAHAMKGERERCLLAGCDEYLPKPLDRKVLIETCSRLIQSLPSSHEGGASQRPLNGSTASR